MTEQELVRAENEDVEGHRAAQAAPSDDDVEGHKLPSRKAVQPGYDEDDVSGHARSY